jgi:hypothetical protein
MEQLPQSTFSSIPLSPTHIIPDFNIEWPATSPSETTPIDWAVLGGISDTSLMKPDPESQNVQVSSTFFCGAMDGPFPTDLVLLSSDQVYFFVHSAVLLKHSGNGLTGLLGDDKVYLPENSEVLNLILHAFYNLDPSKFRPTVALMAATLKSLQKYDVSLDSLLTPSHPMSITILHLGIQSPLETFAMVAAFKLEHLAIEVSKKLVSVPLHNLTDDLAERMGPSYLRRLVFLHLGRIERLKQLLMQPRLSHPVTKDCYESDQKRLQNQWKALAVALGWDAQADLSPQRIYSTFTTLLLKTSCDQCQLVSYPWDFTTYYSRSLESQSRKIPVHLLLTGPLLSPPSSEPQLVENKDVTKHPW